MEDKALPKIFPNFIQNHMSVKQGWHKDAKFWPNYQREYATNNIKNIITPKFKEKLWCHKELKNKRELRYYKEAIILNFKFKNISLFRIGKIQVKIN